MDFGAPNILCVEIDRAVLERRRAVLKSSGYDSTSASPRVAEVALSGQRFDLVIASGLSDIDLQRVTSSCEVANLLVLNEFIMPAELLTLVAQRLNYGR